MRERITVMTRKGQIIIPAEVRRALGIVKGDRVAVSLPDPDTKVVQLRPVQSVAEMTFGAVKPRKQPEAFQELRRQFEDEVAA
jgi:AbrB family looped-hinge helix DNA binding protein